MKNFKTKVGGHGDKEFSFLCYENTEPINVGDKFIFFFAGIANVQIAFKGKLCEINQNDRVRDENKIDLVTGFWKKCYKIKNTDFVSGGSRDCD